MDKKEIILEMQSGERESGLLPSSVSAGNSVDQMVIPTRDETKDVVRITGQTVTNLAPLVGRGFAEGVSGIVAGVNTLTPFSGLAVSGSEGARATQEWEEARYGAAAGAGGGGSLLPPTASQARVGRGASAAAGGASAAGRGSYASELGLSESERRRFAAIQAGLQPYSAGVLSPSSWSAVGQYAVPEAQAGSGGGGGGSIVRGANPIAHIGRTWTPRVVIGQSIGSYHKSSGASRKKASVGIHERRILPVAQTHKGRQNQRKWTLGEWVKTPEARAILIHLASMIRKTLKGGRRIHNGCRKGGNRTRKALSKICKVKCKSVDRRGY